MFSLFNKKKLKIDDISRLKYYLDKEIHLRGIISEEKKLKKRYEEDIQYVPKSCVKNRIHSPYFKLSENLQSNYNRSELFETHDFINNDGKVLWGKLLNVKKTKELDEVFIDNISVNLNINDVEEYQKILREELTEAKQNLGLYKSSWGYLDELNRRIKKLKSNIEFLKNHNLYQQSVNYRIRLILEFDYFGSGTVDIHRQYFKLESLKSIKSINVELDAHECLKLLKLRDWGSCVRDQINSYLEIRKDGIHPGKQNDQFFVNVDDELDIKLIDKTVN